MAPCLEHLGPVLRTDNPDADLESRAECPVHQIMLGAFALAANFRNPPDSSDLSLVPQRRVPDGPSRGDFVDWLTPSQTVCESPRVMAPPGRVAQ